MRSTSPRARSACRFSGAAPVMKDISLARLEQHRYHAHVVVWFHGRGNRAATSYFPMTFDIGFALDISRCCSLVLAIDIRAILLYKIVMSGYVYTAVNASLKIQLLHAKMQCRAIACHGINHQCSRQQCDRVARMLTLMLIPASLPIVININIAFRFSIMRLPLYDLSISYKALAMIFFTYTLLLVSPLHFLIYYGCYTYFRLPSLPLLILHLWFSNIWFLRTPQWRIYLWIFNVRTNRYEGDNNNVVDWTFISSPSYEVDVSTDIMRTYVLCSYKNIYYFYAEDIYIRFRILCDIKFITVIMAFHATAVITATYMFHFN